VVSLDASVTLINNIVTTPGSVGGCAETAGSGSGGSGGTISAPPPPPVSVPEPGTLLLLSSGLLAILFLWNRKPLNSLNS
jgi:hypothetical protein